MTVRSCAIDRMLAGNGSREDEWLNARSGTTGSAAVRRSREAATSLLFLLGMICSKP